MIMCYKKYKYVDASTKGYSKINLTNKEYEEVFNVNRKGFSKWLCKDEVYISEYGVIHIEKFKTFLAFIIITILLPVYVIIEGFFNIDFKREWLYYASVKLQKKHGIFYSNTLLPTEYSIDILNKLEEKGYIKFTQKDGNYSVDIIK